MTKERKFQIAGLLETPQALFHKEQLLQQVTGKTILVTGAAGSIGSEIVKQLLQYIPEDREVKEMLEQCTRESNPA